MKDKRVLLVVRSLTLQLYCEPLSSIEAEVTYYWISHYASFSIFLNTKDRELGATASAKGYQLYELFRISDVPYSDF